MLLPILSINTSRKAPFFMKNFCNFFLLILIGFTHFSFLPAGNQPPQKKRRIENTENAIEEFKSRDTATNQYRTLLPMQQIALLTEKLNNAKKANTLAAEIAAEFRELVPLSKHTAIFNWLANQLLQSTPKERVFMMLALEPIFEDFSHQTAWQPLYESLVQPATYALFPKEINQICQVRAAQTNPNKIHAHQIEINKLSELATRLNQISQPEEFALILAEISNLPPRKQAQFLNETFLLLLRTEIKEKQKFCRQLLLHLKSLVLQTDNKITNLHIMKIIGRITLAGYDQTSRQTLCALANKQHKNLLNNELKTEKRIVIADYIDELIRGLDCNTYWQKELPASQHQAEQEKNEKNLLELLNTTQEANEITFISQLQQPLMRPLIMELGAHFHIENGLQKTYSDLIFYSQGSRLQQKFSPKTQITFLQELQKRTNFAKYALLKKTTLWNHIIDDAVAIEFLKTIATMPEEDQMEYLLQDETDCNSNIFEPYYTASKLSSTFWKKFAKHISTFSLQNQARFFASKLFQDVIPHIRQTSSVAPNLANSLQQLEPQIQWAILRNDSFLGGYLLDEISASHLLETIKLLPAKTKNKLLQKLVSIYVDIPRCTSQSETESSPLIRNLSTGAFLQLVNMLTTLTPQSKISLLSVNPKTLYRLIKYMNTPEQKASVEHLLTSLKKTTLTKQLKEKQKQQHSKIFYSLTSLLLKKPQIELTEEEYYSYAQIPDNLSTEKQSLIVENLLYDSLKLISEEHIPDTDEWIHQHYVLNTIFDFLEQKKNQYEIKDLVTKLKLTGQLQPINEALAQFYDSSFINGGAKQILEELGLTDTYDDNFKKLKKLEAKAQNVLTLCGNKFIKLQQDMRDQTDLRTYFRAKKTQITAPFSDVQICLKKTQ